MDLKPILGESFRSSGLGGLGGILGLVAFVWLSLAYEKPELLAALIPLIPMALAFFFTRDTAASKQAVQTLKSDIQEVKQTVKDEVRKEVKQDMTREVSAEVREQVSKSL